MAWPVLAALGVQSALDFFGARKNRKEQRRVNAKNEQMQRDFAQQGVRWRVEDARAAGVHPVFAMGGSGASASPSHVGDTSMGSAWSSMGQNFSRAISATKTKRERLLDQAMLERAGLENQLLRERIASEVHGRRNVGPPFPAGTNFLPGQGDGPFVENVPVRRNFSEPGRPAQEAGWRPDVSFGRTDTGLVPIIPMSTSESYESDPWGAIGWRIRNQVLPNIRGFSGGRPPAGQLPRGYDYWKWHRGSQEWRPMRQRERPYRG